MECGTLEELRRQKETLRDRIKLTRDRLAGTALPVEQAALRCKIRSYQAALGDLQVQIDHLDPPEQRKAQKERHNQFNVGCLPFDFFEYSGTAWSDLDGHTWRQVEAGDFAELPRCAENIRAWLAEGAERLTSRQKLYLDSYYNQGLAMEAIAQEYGVDKSTVSQVIRNGLDRLREWVDAKRLIAECSRGKGGFDWTRYLAQVPVLTHRQRQLVLLMLSRLPKTQSELADKLELEQSTVSRTLAKAGRTLRRLGVRGGDPVSRPKIRAWETADKYSLALQTGMPLHFYYRCCFRGQRPGGMSRYLYELARRRDAGESAEDVAEEMGLRPKTVRSAFSRLKREGFRVDGIPVPTDGSIGAELDPETYVKLQRLVTCSAGP